jgi:hypothetical protein
LAAVNTILASPLRLWRAASALGFGFLTAAVAAQADDRVADDRAALLSAIHYLENPRNLTRPGAHGELGAYQFRSSTWRMHTAIPFQQALNRETSDVVAEKHYEWLKRGLEAARVPATNYNIALAWNSGLDAAIRGRAPSAAHKYAQRAVNLVSTFDPAPEAKPLVARPAFVTPQIVLAEGQ